MIEREPARLGAGARDDETRTEAVNPLHRQTRDDNVNHAYYTPSGPPLAEESPVSRMLVPASCYDNRSKKCRPTYTGNIFYLQLF